MKNHYRSIDDFWEITSERVYVEEYEDVLSNKNWYKLYEVNIDYTNGRHAAVNTISDSKFTNLNIFRDADPYWDLPTNRTEHDRILNSITKNFPSRQFKVGGSITTEPVFSCWNNPNHLVNTVEVYDSSLYVKLNFLRVRPSSDILLRGWAYSDLRGYHLYGVDIIK
jgi:hypothetical protein